MHSTIVECSGPAKVEHGLVGSARLRAILAERLRALAEARGLPLTHLADRANISRSMLWKILNRESSATVDTVEQLAEVLNVEPIELLR